MSAEIYGLDSEPFDDGSIPIEAIAIVQALDADGDSVLEVRTTKGLTIWERIGMLRMALTIAEGAAHDAWVGRDSRGADEEDDD